MGSECILEDVGAPRGVTPMSEGAREGFPETWCRSPPQGRGLGRQAWEPMAKCMCGRISTSFPRWLHFLHPQDFLGATLHPSSPAFEVPVPFLPLLPMATPALFWEAMTFESHFLESFLPGPERPPLQSSQFFSHC